MSERQPAREPQRQPEPIRPAAVLGGAILGWVLAWVVLAVLLINTGQGETATFGALVALVVFGLLVVPRRTRQAGAGVVLGLAIGMITGTGVCAAMAGSGPLFG